MIEAIDVGEFEYAMTKEKQVKAMLNKINELVEHTKEDNN